MRGENNMGYVIVTDSVLDIEESYLLQNNICTVPLSFTLEGCDTVEDDFGRTVPFSSFYQQLRDGKNVTTSQATVGAFASVFEGILQSRRDVVYIGFSSALSGNFQSGCMARDELKDRYPNRVYCVDTFAASGGQTLIVREAVKRKKEGMTAEQLVEWVEEFRTHVVHWFTVDDLMYLHRGGRVSKSSAVVGSLVGIKPILYVSDDGRLIPDKKVRGRRRSLETLCRQLNAHIREAGQYPVTISHGDCLEDAEYLRDYILKHSQVQEVELHMLDTVIGAHAGPGTVALFFYGDKRGN